MLLGITAAREAACKELAKTLTRLVRERFPDQALTADLGPPVPDVLVAIGDDRFLLDVLRDSGPKTAILAVGMGFLAETTPERAEAAVKSVLAGSFGVEERLRLDVGLGGKKLAPVMNEAALSASRGGGFIRYTLEIDGERVWRDSGDGVIICTPTGSTGYGLSAGGPIVMENAETILIVPICSSTGQHPLVVPRQSSIRITEVESRLAKDVVLDGSTRVRLRASGFSVMESRSPARFVRLGKARYLPIFGKFRSGANSSEKLAGAPPSAKFVYRLLEDQGPLTERQVMAESGLPERTARNALSELIRRKLVQRVPSLRDTREVIFSIMP